MSAGILLEQPPKRNRARLVALAGNPNSGKSTIFNALTGLRQKVANYPGVTVEKKTGRFAGMHGEFMDALDLPGTYSLDAQSPDEAIARDVLLGHRQDTRRPDVVVSVVDASNVERNLYFTTQLGDLGIPVVVALNMVDVAEQKGIRIDPDALERRLGMPVVPMVASKGKGLVELKSRLAQARTTRPGGATLSSSVEDRHARIRETCSGAVRRPDSPRRSLTDRVDAVLTHRVWGWVFFLSLMALLFFSIFQIAAWPMEGIESATAFAGEWLGGRMPAGDLRSLLTDGVVAGVGGVVVFLPQILILFFFLGLLEDSGYMARGAFIMDRLMAMVGLHGKSFIPLLSSFACAIPGVMATRTIENRGDRLATILICPLMSCSARLPVYALMIAVLLPAGTGAAWTKAGIMLAMYVLGVAAAFVTAWLLKRTVFRGEPSMLLLEMPPYRLPSLRNTFLRMWERGRIFLTHAGTTILALSIVLWAMMTYPKPAQSDTPPSQALSGSLAGRMGHALEPVIRPLGYDWKIGIGLIASFAAREAFVGTMAIVHNVGDDGDGSGTLRDALRAERRADGSPVYTPLVCIGLMAFYVLSMQCMSTLAVVRRETNSWRWPIFQFAYMTALAYGASLLIYQGGRLLGFQ
jgi:ferrous iron transport protein B